MKEFNDETTSPQAPPRESFNDHGEDEVYREIPPNEKIVCPKPISQTLPPYTSAARKLRAEGVVVLNVIIDKDGNTRIQDILKPLGLGLDESAIEAVSKWKFSPALLNNNPINILSTVEVEYKVE